VDRRSFFTAEQAARLYTDAMVPYNGDIFMADYSEEGCTPRARSNRLHGLSIMKNSGSGGRFLRLAMAHVHYLHH
jgi:hypothetical protein